MGLSVHPRTRGEQGGKFGEDYADIGSSPHSRGTGTRATSICNRRAVHPRTRGEQTDMFASKASIAGSSPHSRGTDLQSCYHAQSARFIPALAGNRPHPRRGARCVAVHPRTRGEQCVSIAAMDSGTGSSPHSRGTEASTDIRDWVWRFIPALAGNSGTATAPPSRPSVHPRTRGEQSPK